MRTYNLKSGVVLKPHQPSAIDFCLLHHYSILADDMGLGKSLESLAVCTQSKLRTLVICPAYLKENWKAEVSLFTNLKAQVITKPQGFKPRDNTDIIIGSYSQLKHIRHLFSSVRMVIADECHYLKGVDTQRSELFHEYIDGSRPERLLLLSGTPIKNRVSEYYSLLCLASYNPRGSSGLRIFDRFSNYYAFLNTFSTPKKIKIGGGKSITKYEGMRNVDLLKTFLKDKMIRRLAKDVLDLQESIDKDVYIKFDTDPILKEIWEDFLENPAGNPHISSRKAKSALEKADFTCKYVEDIVNEGNPCIVFTDHVDSAECIAHYFGQKARLITGNVPSEVRGKIVVGFQRGDFNILVATIGSASTGFTLTRANNMVFNDISFVGANNEQAKKRINRIGQEKRCIYHFILGSKEDKLIQKTVDNKEKDLRRIYGD